ncbi:hypothetical protein RLOatenuis_7700 [Rickettsiales bacterium]|nr:hypothetical protein RLOatenuis_7700 [Rickettsiales bacterium]
MRKEAGARIVKLLKIINNLANSTILPEDRVSFGLPLPHKDKVAIIKKFKVPLGQIRIESVCKKPTGELLTLLTFPDMKLNNRDAILGLLEFFGFNPKARFPASISIPCKDLVNNTAALFKADLTEYLVKAVFSNDIFTLEDALKLINESCNLPKQDSFMQERLKEFLDVAANSAACVTLTEEESHYRRIGTQFISLDREDFYKHCRLSDQSDKEAIQVKIKDLPRRLSFIDLLLRTCFNVNVRSTFYGKSFDFCDMEFTIPHEKFVKALRCTDNAIHSLKSVTERKQQNPDTQIWISSLEDAISDAVKQAGPER